MAISTHNLRIELGEIRLVIPVTDVKPDEQVIDMVRAEILPMLIKERLTNYNLLSNISKWVNGRCKKE